jgi:hypothetical protein
VISASPNGQGFEDRESSMRVYKFLSADDDLFRMTRAALALAGDSRYAKLIEETAFTPFIRP